MLFELVLVGAFVFSAIYALIEIRSLEQEKVAQEEYYRDLIEQILHSERGSQEHACGLWEELDTRRLEVTGLEHQLEEAREENEVLRARLSEYWIASN